MERVRSDEVRGRRMRLPPHEGHFVMSIPVTRRKISCQVELFTSGSVCPWPSGPFFNGSG
jgi:hypothetical protein